MDNVKFESEKSKKEFLEFYPEKADYYNDSSTIEGSISDYRNHYEFCLDCKLVKPERVYHCDICEKCYLRMDHHCNWIGNCVGLHNHKFFLMFLFYASSITFLIFITCVFELKTEFQKLSNSVLLKDSQFDWVYL